MNGVSTNSKLGLSKVGQHQRYCFKLLKFLFILIFISPNSSYSATQFYRCDAFTGLTEEEAIRNLCDARSESSGEIFESEVLIRPVGEPLGRCLRPEGHPPHLGTVAHICPIQTRFCPEEQNEDALFDVFYFTGQCDCSDTVNYEARNFPRANPPQVGCFRITPEEPEDEADKDDGCSGENSTNNPCNVATGNKYKSQTDISGNLGFTRSYNSNNLVDLGLGKGWRSVYQKRLIVSGDSLTLASGTGRGEPWTKTGGLWSGDADSDFIVTEDASGFTVTRQNGDAEQYDLSGNLLSETDTQGKTTSYAYDANNQLISVTDHFGEVLNFSYDANGHLETVTDAAGDVYRYEYDANDNLVTVIYPDTTPGDAADNPRTIYHYENIDFPNHLTGITDENGDRYQSYAYDANGKAIQSEKASTSSAVGQERMQLDYQE